MFNIRRIAAENHNKLPLIYNEFKDTLYDIQPAIDALNDTNSVKFTLKAIKKYYIDQLNNAKEAYELINQQNITRQTTNYNVEAQAYIKEILEKHRQKQKDIENQYNEQLIAVTVAIQEQVQNLETIRTQSQAEINNLKIQINTINQTLMQNQANLDQTRQQLAQLATENQLNRANQNNPNQYAIAPVNPIIPPIARGMEV